MSIGEKYGPAMEIHTKGEAEEYFCRLVAMAMKKNPSLNEQEAVAQELANLGYWAGYYSHETRLRVQELFGAQHPVFGRAL